MSRRPLVDPRILVLLTVALCLALLAACGGADTATQAPEADATIAPTAAATQAAPAQPMATTPPQPAATSTPVPQAQPTATAAAPTSDRVVPTGTINVGYKELGLFGTDPKLTPGQVMLFVGSVVSESLLSTTVDGNFLPKLVTDWSVTPTVLFGHSSWQEGVQFHKGLVR